MSPVATWRRGATNVKDIRVGTDDRQRIATKDTPRVAGNATVVFAIVAIHRWVAQRCEASLVSKDDQRRTVGRWGHLQLQ
jgi:hypothetical protein